MDCISFPILLVACCMCVHGIRLRMNPRIFAVSLLHIMILFPSSREQITQSTNDPYEESDEEFGSIVDDFDLFPSAWSESLNWNSSEDDIEGHLIVDEAETMAGFNLHPASMAHTNQGTLKGSLDRSRNGKLYYSFRGIPYASAPVGKLRFEPPKPHPGWKGIRDATYFRSECMQILVYANLVTGSEDCLFLNIYTRKAHNKLQVPFIKNSGIHPVIVFIPGGLFMLGGSNMYGARYFLDEDVVLVTLNYRLASFGFLNTGNGRIEGNLGLKDQTMALRWIQDNIKFFNGDKDRVTLMGQSAGAVCVHLHTLSPMSKGLFSGAISQSGTALSTWGIIEEPEAQSKEFAAGLGCPTQNPDKMVKCLKKLPARKIAMSHHGYIKALAAGKRTMFGPTVESVHDGETFLPTSPLELLRNGSISGTPWIAGVNSGEGLVNLVPIMQNKKLRKTLNSKWKLLAPKLFHYELHSDEKAISIKIKKYYLGDKPMSHSNLNGAARLFSDRNFFLDNHDAAILQSRVAPTYVYYYTYQGIFSIGNLLFTKLPLPLPDDVNYKVGAMVEWIRTVLGIKRTSKYGISHGDEMALMFNVPLVRREVVSSDADYEVSRKLIQLWVSFAENGVPSSSRFGKSLSWPTVEEANPDLKDVPLQYLNIDKQFSIIREPFHEGIQFWKNHSISNL